MNYKAIIHEHEGKLWIRKQTDQGHWEDSSFEEWLRNMIQEATEDVLSTSEAQVSGNQL